MPPPVYIHEFIDIIGHNRGRYMHHMTANWCPVARAERNQLCLGVWATLGSTGRWPEVVNMWELDGWDGLAANFAHETGGGKDQDPALAEWWATAASLRRGGVDRIVVPEPWTRPVDAVDRGRGAGRAVRPRARDGAGRDGAGTTSTRSTVEGRPAVEALGLEAIGAYRVAMVNDSEAIVLWAIPDWATWTRFEQAWSSPSGELDALAQDDARAPGRLAPHPPDRLAAQPAAHRPPARSVRPPPPGPGAD